MMTIAMASSKTQRAGTPLYMSPEANDGHAHAPADIFAAGIIAIEMATKAWPPNILRTADQVNACRVLVPGMPHTLYLHTIFHIVRSPTHATGE